MVKNHGLEYDIIQFKYKLSWLPLIFQKAADMYSLLINSWSSQLVNMDSVPTILILNRHVEKSKLGIINYLFNHS